MRESVADDRIARRSALAERLVRFAGDMMLDGYHKRLRVEQKSLHDYVSQLDIDIEQSMRNEIKLLFPGDSILGEELGDSHGQPDSIKWIIDPIDGTNNFIRTLPLAGTQIAIEQGGEVVYSIAYQPFTEDLTWATRGLGSYSKNLQTRDIVKMKVSSRRLSEAMVIFDAGAPLQNSYSAIALNRLKSHISGGRIFGVAVMDLPAIASGAADILISSVAEPYDIAPGSLFVTEAGGALYNEHGDPWRSSDRTVIVGGRQIVEEFFERIGRVS